MLPAQQPEIVLLDDDEDDGDDDQRTTPTQSLPSSHLFTRFVQSSSTQQVAAGSSSESTCNSKSAAIRSASNLLISSVDPSFDAGYDEPVSPYTPSKRKLEEMQRFDESSDDELYGEESMQLTFTKASSSNSSTNATTGSNEDSSSFYVTGSNAFGMLGIGNAVSDSSKITSFTRMNNPAIVPSNIKIMACGHYHTVVVTKDNQIYACGKNNYGQLAMGNLTKVFPIFKMVESSMNGIPKELIRDVKCGRYHTMFITDQPSDNVWVCGKNKSGQMSLPSANIYPSPTRLIAQFSGKVLFASCGSEFTFIKTTDGVYSCGDNSRGQCGLGVDTLQVKSFKPLKTNFSRLNITQIECGEFHSLFLTASGDLYGSGTSVNGQLGFDPQLLGRQSVNSPVKIDTPLNETIKQIRCGFHHSAFLTLSGKIYICGRNGDGQLSCGEPTPRLFTFTHIPISASSLSHHFVQELYCYSYYSIAITDKMEMFLTGSNKCGQLGTGEGQRVDKFTRTFKHRVKAVYCGRDTLMVEAEDREYNEAIYDDTFGKMLNFDDSNLAPLLDSFIICSDGKKFPILYDFVLIRFPLLEKYSKEVTEEECSSSSTEPPTKKRKSGGQDQTMKVIDLSPIATLSSNSILKLLTYICTDVVDDRDPTSIQEDLKIIQWITENSGLDFSSSSQDASNTTRFIKLILQKILSSITNTTVVNVLETLQVLKKHPLIINLYRHCIALIRKIEKTYTINEIANFSQLSKEALIETLAFGENYHCLGSSDISVPPSSFSTNLEQLFNKAQQSKGTMGDVTLLLNKEGTRVLYAHKAILAVKCDFFKLKFTSGMGDMDSRRVEIYEYADENEIRAQEEFIRYLYTDKVELSKNNAISFLTRWNFYSMDINNPISVKCQEIIVDGLNEQNVLEFQKSFFLDRSSPYHFLRKACVQSLIKYWPSINEKYSKQQIMEYMSYDRYIKVTQAYLKFFTKRANQLQQQLQTLQQQTAPTVLQN
ncbi:hypothetical protein C9374_012328 [Naegleria lovaniensis]|uniref:BTB domain-containing protein n=1 Tax=Naegleria lovaniensis TaxID=51637 RepID=A0AA88GD11_NAELO|nr:uncharacterized protein C9374_012328 [Naegleria lovaniensis]KAG2373225.1 hypothetical protein C9374_012328 [Naegleria lovaniensis]